MLPSLRWAASRALRISIFDRRPRHTSNPHTIHLDGPPFGLLDSTLIPCVSMQYYI